MAQLTSHGLCACLAVRTLLLSQFNGRYINSISKLVGFVKLRFEAVEPVPRAFQAKARCRCSEIDYTLQINQLNSCTWRCSCKFGARYYWHFQHRIHAPGSRLTAMETLHANVSSVLTDMLVPYSNDTRITYLFVGLAAQVRLKCAAFLCASSVHV